MAKNVFLIYSRDGSGLYVENGVLSKSFQNLRNVWTLRRRHSFVVLMTDGRGGSADTVLRNGAFDSAGSIRRRRWRVHVGHAAIAVTGMGHAHPGLGRGSRKWTFLLKIGWRADRRAGLAIVGRSVAEDVFVAPFR